MAQPQQNITLTAPGFLGLNLEDAPIDMDQRHALEADHAVIDRFGRLGARKGFDTFLTGGMPDSSAVVESLGVVVDGGVERVIAGVSTTGGNFIWEISDLGGTPTATQLSLPVGYTLSSANVQIISYAGYGIIAGGGEILYLSGGVLDVISNGPSFILPQDDSGVAVATLDFDTGTAAYGRLWMSGGSGGEETIYYSSLNNPFQWYDGRAVPANAFNTGGIIDVFESWPSGRDRIVDVVAHNNLLIVFGRSSILVYGNPQGDPAAAGGIYLADTIKNIGLVDRDATVSDGRDILFVDDTGLRSLGRTIQEQSAAIGDLTRTVRTAFQRELQKLAFDSARGVELVYDPNNSFVLIILRGSKDVWVADTRMPLPDGSLRITRWPGAPLACGVYVESDNLLMLGCESGAPVAAYRENKDFGTSSYNFVYASPILSFGDPVRSKFVKQIDYTVVSGLDESTATGSWEYYGIRPYEKDKFITLDGGVASLYDDASFKFNDATFGQGSEIIRSYRINADGSGENVSVKFASTIDNTLCSQQQVNIQALLGRIT
jgi:hypothetical protein